MGLLLDSLVWDFKTCFYFFGSRIVCAILCGGILGLERAFKHKAAGLKTNILICLGATLFTCVSILMVDGLSPQRPLLGDPSRVTAQIVSGIGFLGMGVFVHSRGVVVGLTTAALMWVVAAIGVCIGIGHFGVAVSCSLILVTILRLSTFLESFLFGKNQLFECEIIMKEVESSMARSEINGLLAKNHLTLNHFTMEYQNQSESIFTICFNIHYCGFAQDHHNFILELWRLASIQGVKTL